MHDTILPVLASFAIFLILLLLASPTQWRVRNTGTLFNIGWLLAGNLIFLVNAVVWRDNVVNSAPVWCDISVKVQAGIHTGISGASLCINRRLAAIASSKAIKSNRARKLDLGIDIACGLGLPLVVMALSYVVQGHRFNLIEGYGCEFFGYPSIPAIFLYFIWPLVLSTASATFGVIAVYHFVSKRLEFRTLLKSSRSGLDTSHFIRLLCIASIDLAVAVPIDIYLIVRVSENLLPWLSRKEFYADWDQVGQIPAMAWLTSPQWILDGVLPRYVFPAVAFAFFALIGVTEDSVGEYLRVFRYVSLRLGLRKPVIVLPQPVTLGSTVSRADGRFMPPDSARSKDGSFGFESTDISPTSPRFAESRQRLAVSVERQVV